MTRRDTTAHEDAWHLAAELLGMQGTMLSGQKKAPAVKRVVWNGNVCTKEHGKIWYGDISIKDSYKQLQALATQLATDVYVLRERDARFANEASPLFENAVEVIAPVSTKETR